ncbi:MAG: adenylyl-sulfate kinase [Clostridiales bacterium]|nr:adenylyl-sulfate kinase [Clostridiales bacterium]
MNDLLKFITCGSVDDGKSTLIGHILYDAKLLFADQKEALVLDSKVGSTDGDIDYSLLLDGLTAEREQGITIDVAYRYFTTDKRSFIVADTPGHEQYTRNMAVGASFADLAIILVDASQGVLVQTKRHARICSLMGINYFVFAVNKMDLVSYDNAVFEKIEEQIKALSDELKLKNVKIIPVSATEDDNITEKSENMPWYTGEPILDYLENVEVKTADDEAGFYMPVQRVCRPNRTFRGFQGQIEAGTVNIGDEVTALPSDEKAEVKSITIGDKESESAFEGQPVTITLNREIDVSRGSVLSKDSGIKTARRFNATLLWMDDSHLSVGKEYFIKLGTRKITGSIKKIIFKTDINSGEKPEASYITKNEIAACEIILDEEIPISEFKKHKTLGELIIIDRVSNMTSACGVVEKVLRYDDNIVWHQMSITREIRAGQKAQQPKTLWFTGLSGAGKSTLVNEVEKRLVANGRHTMILDGDNVRLGLNNNLGFEKKDRTENIRRVAEVCKLMNDAGLIAIAALVSPYAKDRNNARKIVGKDDFIEIYVSTPIEECERRDIKGFYKKARENEISDFTGVSSDYEPPRTPQITIDATGKTIEESVNYIMGELEKYGV